MQMDSDLVIYRTTLVRTFQVVTIYRVDKSEVTQILLSQLRFWTISSQLRSVQSAVSSQQSAEICIVISQQSVVNTDSVQSAVNSAMTGQLSFGRSTQL
ncbi:hypothetical protein F511_34350 [Dorcoceras hygrometricum]|uniref:Uncharacterized protein n=1 Tax=Dorcoceras hygrometricum TaxID=472368 RepID=A0A2Z7BUR6_9LAMI|nr:hypothetical protein F511_34350 [Dorcoceras hygrometricum]